MEKGERRKEKGRKEKERREKGRKEEAERRKGEGRVAKGISCEARKWAKDEPGKYASSLWGFAHHDTNHDSAKPQERTSREERAARARGTHAWRRPVRRRRKSRG